MRMYTSYKGIRSTGGAVAPSGSRFKKCVLAATPSLWMLTQLPIGIVVVIVPAGPRRRQPGVELRRHQTVRALLTLGGAHGEVVRVLVLRVARVPLDPAPRNVVRSRGLDELLPQLQVLERTAFAFPSSGFPSFHPLAHPLHEVLRVGHVRDPAAL